MLYLRQSTASQSVILGVFVDSTDGSSLETGLTIANTDIRLSKNGGNVVAKNSGGATHDEGGYYTATFDATDSDTVGRLQVFVNASGALPVYHEFQVIETAIYDGMFADGATAIPADVVSLSGDTTAADNAESFFDGTGYAGTNNVIPSVTNVTGGINTGAGTITTLDGLDTAQDTQHSTTQSAISALNDPTAAAIADAVWDEDATGHQTTGTFGAAIGDPGVNTETIYDAVITDAAGTNIAADIIAIDAVADAILVDTGTTLPGVIGTPTDLGGGATLADNNADMAGGTFSSSTDSLEALRDRGDAAWTTGAGGTPPQLLQSTTIATLASQTSFTLTAGSADDDAYNGAIAVITDQSTAVQKCYATIDDYVGSTRTVTLSADPAIFTMAVGDSIVIMTPLGAAGSAPTAGQVADAVWDEVRSGHTTAGTFGEIAVAGTLGVDVTAISGDSTAADNLEAMYDGTGYTADTAPASRSQVAGLALAGGGTGIAATVTDSNADGTDPLNGVTFVGTVSSGSSANLTAQGGTGITIDDATNEIDVVFELTAPRNAVPTSIMFDGYLNSANDTAPIQVYDHDGTAWVTVATLNGQGGSTNNSLDIALGEARFTSSAGIIYVRFHSTATDNQTLFIDRLVVGYVNRTVGYASGRIWVDDGASNTGTEVFVDGVADNPVSTLAAATTLGTALGIDSYHFSTGSSFTLAAAFENKIVQGDNYVLALGGQSISGTIFEKFGPVSGTATGAVPPVFNSGPIGTVTLPACVMIACGFTAAFTANSTGNYQFNDCHSQVAGSGAPTFDFSGQGGATTAQFRRWSGGITVTLDSDVTMSIDIVSGGTVTVNGTGGTVVVRGLCNVVDGSSGSVTITETSVVNMTKINAEVDTAISDASLATAAALATVDANVDSILEDTGTTLPATLATIDDIVDAILVDTAEIGTAGAGLTEAGGTGDHLTAVPWNAAWDAEVQSEVTDALNAYDPPTRAELTSDIGTVTTAISGLNDLSAAQVNAQVVDALDTDTYAEPTGVPPATASVTDKLGYVYMALRNEVTVTASKKTYHDDAGNPEWEQDLSDDGTTYTQSEANSV